MSRDWWSMTWLVTRRELAAQGRARSYWVATVVLLLGVIAGAVIPALVTSSSSKPHAAVHIGIVGGPVAALSQAVRTSGQIGKTPVIVSTPPTAAVAAAQVRSGKLDAAVIDDAQVLIKQTSATGDESSPGYGLAQVAGLMKAFPQLSPQAAAVVATNRTALPVRGVTPPGRSLASRITGLVAVILIFIVLSIYGSRIAIGVGEEKTSRVVEVLLTTLRPVQLLVGKVIGMGLLTLAQVAAMVACYLLAGNLAGSTAVHGASAEVVLLGAVWLVLGYAFYCTAFAAAGSLIARQSDVSNAMFPLQIPLIVGYISTYTVIYGTTVNPFFHVLTFIPFTAPVTMPVLVAMGAAPVWQTILSIAIMLAATVIMVRLAATIYERAILRSGSRLKVRQVLRAAA